MMSLFFYYSLFQYFFYNIQKLFNKIMQNKTKFIFQE